MILSFINRAYCVPYTTIMAHLHKSTRHNQLDAVWCVPFFFFFVVLAGIDAVNIVVVDYRFGVNVDTNIAIIINIDCQYITIFDIREP